MTVLLPEASSAGGLNNVELFLRPPATDGDGGVIDVDTNAANCAVGVVVVRGDAEDVAVGRVHGAGDVVRHFLGRSYRGGVW